MLESELSDSEHRWATEILLTNRDGKPCQAVFLRCAVAVIVAASQIRQEADAQSITQAQSTQMRNLSVHKTHHSAYFLFFAFHRWQTWWRPPISLNRQESKEIWKMWEGKRDCFRVLLSIFMYTRWEMFWTNASFQHIGQDDLASKTLLGSPEEHKTLTCWIKRIVAYGHVGLLWRDASPLTYVLQSELFFWNCTAHFFVAPGYCCIYMHHLMNNNYCWYPSTRETPFDDLFLDENLSPTVSRTACVAIVKTMIRGLSSNFDFLLLPSIVS